MDKIKVGFIGLGQRGNGWLGFILNEWKKDIDVVAVCDSYGDRTQNAVDDIKKIRGTNANGYTPISYKHPPPSL